MQHDVIVTAPAARDLVCPFTGKRLVVHMYIKPEGFIFCAPDAFTLSEPVDKIDTLYRRASMRNGVEGMATQGLRNIDPYTGSPLRLRTLEDGRVSLVGGFNPRSACTSLEEFVYKASMRDGKTDIPVPQVTQRVAAPEKPKHIAKPKDIELSEDALRVADAAVRKSGKFQNKTSVRIERKG